MATIFQGLLATLLIVLFTNLACSNTDVGNKQQAAGGLGHLTNPSNPHEPVLLNRCMCTPKSPQCCIAEKKECRCSPKSPQCCIAEKKECRCSPKSPQCCEGEKKCKCSPKSLTCCSLDDIEKMEEEKKMVKASNFMKKRE